MGRFRDAWNAVMGRGPYCRATAKVRREWVGIQLDIENQMSQLERMVQRLAARERRVTTAAVQIVPTAQRELPLAGPALNGRLALKSRKAALRHRRSAGTDDPTRPDYRTIPESEEPNEPIGEEGQVSG